MSLTRGVSDTATTGSMAVVVAATLADRIDALLPQTQCTRCGYPACRPYAEAIAEGLAPINQCPPGGAAGIRQLAQLLDVPAIPLNPQHGIEGPIELARIDEAVCIGCTLCIQACPVDAIVGAPKLMHTVIADQCTGCLLCLPPCPVDCIELVPAPFAWDAMRAAQARQRFNGRNARLEAEQQAAAARQHAEDEAARKQAVIAAALARARQQRAAAPPR